MGAIISAGNKETTANVLKWDEPVDGIITSPYGYRTNPILGVLELHDGVDLLAKEGTPALAVDNGVVTNVGVSKTYGNYLKYSVDGYVVMYAHLSSVKVKDGDYVKKGETIALTGSTGLVTGPHLHFSVYQNGKSIDPLSLNFVTENRGGQNNG